MFSIKAKALAKFSSIDKPNHPKIRIHVIFKVAIAICKFQRYFIFIINIDLKMWHCIIS